MNWHALGNDLAAARAALFARTQASDLAYLGARYSALLAGQPTHVYNRFDPSMIAFWSGLCERGSAAMGDASALAMLNGIAACRTGSAPPTDIFATETARWQSRIVRMIAAGETQSYEEPGETLYKDLGACRGAGFVAGAWIVHEASPARRFLIAGGVGSAVRSLPFFARHVLGRKRWLSAFLNPHEKVHFNAVGFTLVARAVAARLAADHDLAGLFLGASWLYDPALPRISPRLGFHRAIALPGGARTFLSAREGAQSWALNASPTRRAAFEAGDYRPQSHILFWPRTALIDWAARTP